MDQGVIGKVIDTYQITRVLGKGGMGIVYKAKDITLDRDVALKLMDASLARDESFLKRFQSEAKALAKLQNPNIVSVFALRETELGFCIVMEFVEGTTLADKIKQGGPMPLKMVIPVFKQMLTALDYAHRAGIIHRDIKPSNIMLTEQNVVKVTDFGLAKIQQVSAATMTLGTGGTLYYMSPEQVRGLANVDARGDIYSLGMTLYECVTGKVPFADSDADFTIRQAIVEGKIPSPDKIGAGLPKELVKVIMKAIDKDPDKRYQSAAEMREALEKIEGGLERYGAPQRDQATRIAAVQTTTKSRRPFVVLGVVLFLAVGGFIVYRSVIVPSEPQPTVGANQASLSTRDTVPAEEVPRPIESTQQTKGPVATPSNLNGATKTGTLVLQAIPGGSVSVDGEEKLENVAKVSEVQVRAGSRSVSFRHPNYGSKTFRIDVQPDERKRLTCYFIGYVSVLSQPVWGSIVIDGKPTDLVTPIDRYQLAPGKHTVTVRRTGYETVEGVREVAIESGTEEQVIPLVFNLKKQN